MTSITAIVPTFNRAAYLPEALNAIRQQTRPVDEILVVDDGSTDETAQVVAAFPAPVRYLRQANGGKSVALNRGLEHATGDLVWVCDDDDIPLPDAMEHLTGALERKNAGYAFGTYRRFRTDPATGEAETYSCGYWPDLEGRSYFTALLEDFFLFQNATLVRRDAYREVGPFREDLVRSQDYEMAIRIARHSKGVHVDRDIFLQRVHDGDRGSVQERFGSEEQVARWLASDQRIFARLLADMPLSEFGREAAIADVPDFTRAALIQRACIFTRRRMWKEASADLNRAARMARDFPLSDHERAVCRRFLLSKYGCDWFVQQDAPARSLKSLSQTGPVGRQLARDITRPLLWRTREAITEGRVRTGLSFAALMLSARAPRAYAGSLAPWERPLMEQMR